MILTRKITIDDAIHINQITEAQQFAEPRQQSSNMISWDVLGCIVHTQVYTRRHENWSISDFVVEELRTRGDVCLILLNFNLESWADAAADKRIFNRQNYDLRLNIGPLLNGRPPWHRVTLALPPPPRHNWAPPPRMPRRVPTDQKKPRYW